MFLYLQYNNLVSRSFSQAWERGWQPNSVMILCVKSNWLENCSVLQKLDIFIGKNGLSTC